MNTILTSCPYVQNVQARKHLRGGRLSCASGLFGAVARRGRPALLAAIVLLLPRLAAAQSAPVQPRITARVNESDLTTLRSNTHPLARAQYDQGAVADSQPMHRMLLLLQRSPAQDAGLKQLVDEQQSKSSPSYHKWLTPQQIGQQYGPADADIQTVTDWLQSHGFQVARVSAAKTLIEFSGTAGQIRNAFHTEIHRYNVNGEAHFANNSDPQIPTALASVVAGPVSLHNFPHKALTTKLGVFRKEKDTGRVTPLNTPVVPLFTIGGCGSLVYCNAVAPGDFANIYSVSTLWNTGISGTKIDGTGQTIAIVGNSEICTATMPAADFTDPNICKGNDDVAQFRQLFGLPLTNPITNQSELPTVILDGPDPYLNGDETEGDLDVEWSGAVAKGATIDYVIAESTEATRGTDLAAEYIIDNNLAPVMSESYGECEYDLGNNGNEFESALWEQAAAQGITVIVSAGDSGSAACDNFVTEGAAGQDGVNFGPGVNGIASTPFNVAAGGTDFDTTANNYQNYWGGPDTQASGYVSAEGYIPETTWNDSCAQNLTTVVTLSDYCGQITRGGIVAGSGGQSNCVAPYEGIHCYFYYAKPSWQTLASGSGLTAANDMTRDVPDISLFAANGSISFSFYIICEADFTGGPCNLNAGYFDFVAVGGTSSSAPAFAGMMALVNQNIEVNHAALSDPTFGARQGNANYVLYNLASSQNPSICSSTAGPIASCTFNDITKGNNSVPCVGGSLGCSQKNDGLGIEEAVDFVTGNPTGLPAWDTAVGLDLASGLGSVNAYNLVNNWAEAVGKFTPTTTTLCLAKAPTSLASCTAPSNTPITITHGQTMYVNTQVNAGANAIPVSETDILAEDVSLVATFPNGNTSCHVPGCNTAGIVHFTSNSYNVSNADIYPLTDGTTVGLGYSTKYLVGGTYNVVAHYTGDGTFGSSDSTSPMYVTVNPEGSTTTLSLGTFDPLTGKLFSASPIPYGDLTNVRVDVVGSSSGQENASGTVTLTDNGGAIVNQAGGTNPLNQFSLNTEGYSEDQTAYLAVGSHSFQAAYLGDASYTASTSSGRVPLTVSMAATATTVTASTLGTASLGQSVTLTATVGTTSLGLAPTGSVQFSINGVAFGGPVAIVGGVNPSTGFAQAIATTVTTTLASGSDAITAQYLSDVDYSASPVSTPPLTIAVEPGSVSLAPGILCGAVTTTISAPGQQTGGCPIDVMAANGFTGTVTLSYAVTTTPENAVDFPTCTFGSPAVNFSPPNTITLGSTGGTSGSATLTCSSTAASSVVLRPSNRPIGRDWPLAAAALPLVCFIFLLAVPSQRRWRLVPVAVLLVVVATAGLSCGGSSTSSGSAGNPGTTPGSYTITVTATPTPGGAQAAQMIPITVNVQ